jgi:hypothetical protein
MTHVKFLRLSADNGENITAKLAKLYADGWSVVSHCDDGREYSFVLERYESEKPKALDATKAP